MKTRTCSKTLKTVAGLLAGAFLAVGARDTALARDGALSTSTLSRAKAKGAVRVIVKLDLPDRPQSATEGSAGLSRHRQAIAQTQSAVLSDLGKAQAAVHHQFATIPFMAMTVNASTLEALEKSPRVVAIQEDRAFPATLSDSVPIVEADQAWASGFDGSGQVVAVLDTGVDRNHPFLAGRVVDEACFSGNGDCPNGATSAFGPGAAQPCDYADGCRHGTHVAGIAAGRGNDISGIARGAGVIGIKVFSYFSGPEDCGDGEDPCTLSYSSDQVAALEHVFKLKNSHPIASVNMSIGGGKYGSQSACDAENSAMKAAIDQLRSVGVATVISSGNEGYTDGISAPACISSAISVGSTTKNDGISIFSNSVSFLSLLAPGSSITSSVPGGGFDVMSGTSMAAPHVTGAWAVLKQKAPNASVDEVLNALRSTGVPLTDPTNDVTTPRIRVAAALGALRGSSPAPQPGPGPTPRRNSTVQITPDGLRHLVSKTIGDARWAITYNNDDDTVTGNVYFQSGGDPLFVWCQRVWDNGDSSNLEITFECYGAAPCSADTCSVDNWNFVDNVTMPAAFFLPPA